MPGWWLAPIVGAALIAWILSAATRQELLVTAGVLACATLAYVIRNRAQ
jgi:positive regulator of sigma E activity